MYIQRFCIILPTLTINLSFQDEWRLFIAGGTHVPQELPNPSPDWISERMWKDILTLPTLSKFSTLAEEFPQYLDQFKTVFDSAMPHKEPLPGHWENDLDEFQKMVVLKSASGTCI